MVDLNNWQLYEHERHRILQILNNIEDFAVVPASLNGYYMYLTDFLMVYVYLKQHRHRGKCLLVLYMSRKLLSCGMSLYFDSPRNFGQNCKMKWPINIRIS